MQLYGSARSPFARKTRVAAHEAGLSASISMVDILAITTKPDPRLLAVNPLGKIPVLVIEDGTALFDSHVICDWLDRRGGGGLIPRADPERTAALRREAIADGLAELFLAVRAEARRPEAGRQPALSQAYRNRINGVLDWLEASASSSLEQDAAMNVGDVAVACVLDYADFRFPELAWRNRRPRLAAWQAAAAARPSMASTPYSDEAAGGKP